MASLTTTPRREAPVSALRDSASAEVPPGLQPFHEFCASRLAPAAMIANRLASPLLGQAWASALVMHWGRLHSLGGLDLSQPLYVTDLAPAQGQLARVLLPALERELHARGLRHWPVRYLACSPSRTSQLALHAELGDQPALAGHLHSGLLDTVCWPIQTGQPLVHGPQRLPLFGARNPVAALALGAWSRQPSRLYAAHHGQLLQGLVRPAPAGAGDGSLTLAYEWQDVAGPAGGGTPEALLIAHYLAGLPSAPFVLSEAALAQIDAVADFSAGRYLLLCADLGVTDERQIRARALAPPAATEPGGLLVPVNFHALTRHQRLTGAAVSQQQCQDGGWVLHLACRDDRLGVDPTAWQHLAQTLQDAHPDDRARDCTSGAPIRDAADLEHRLRRSGGDPWALVDALHSLEGITMQLDPVAAQSLARALATAWARTGGDLRGAALGCAVSRLAAELGDWGLARHVLVQSGPADAAEQAQLCQLRAVVEAQTGNAEGALLWARRALQADAAQPDSLALVAQLRARLQAWTGQRWYVPRHMGSGDLCLEPLHEGHHEALRCQMRDPLIGALAQMQPPTPEAAPSDGSVDFALMHADQGVVGQIGFRHHTDMAHFHLWIGADFQGQGLGTRAMTLLLGVLAAAGIEHAFSVVYRHNQRCRRLLARLGFSELPDAADEDEAPWVVVHRATAVTDVPVGQAQLLQRWEHLSAALDGPSEPIV